MSAKQLRVIGNKVLIRPTPPPETTPGGIVLAVAYQQPSGDGWVVAVGGRCEHVKPGDRVTFSWINGREIEWAGETLKVITEPELIGVVGGDA